jgi:chromosomal replication initiator protein
MPTITPDFWPQCIERLTQELSPQQINMWIRPLQPEFKDDRVLVLWAPNRFVLDMVAQQLQAKILDQAQTLLNRPMLEISLQVGSAQAAAPATEPIAPASSTTPLLPPKNRAIEESVHQEVPPNGEHKEFISHINSQLNFENFVEGKSNQLARAAAQQVAQNPGSGYNPLFIYGGVGLGKTHLMQAVGNAILEHSPAAKVVYLHSERYVQQMVSSIKNNTIEDFKNYYRSVNALLIDDIQFFAGKNRSQEEFFHTFNALIEQGQQIIMTCDRYPKEIEGLEERLKSRFGWGLTVAVEPPDLETRVAILQRKAELSHITLSTEVAFFVAKRIRANIRELEGALRLVIATAQFTGRPITVESAKEALKDLIAAQAKMITLENIQRTVAKYYNLKVTDLTGIRRSRSIARPRQVAMSLAKELTNHSLPEIGEAFGGRDHTTVIHACKKIEELREIETKLNDDYNLLRHTLNV